MIGLRIPVAGGRNAKLGWSFFSPQQRGAGHVSSWRGNCGAKRPGAASPVRGRGGRVGEGIGMRGETEQRVEGKEEDRMASETKADGGGVGKVKEERNEGKRRRKETEKVKTGEGREWGGETRKGKNGPKRQGNARGGTRCQEL